MVEFCLRYFDLLDLLDLQKCLGSQPGSRQRLARNEWQLLMNGPPLADERFPLLPVRFRCADEMRPVQKNQPPKPASSQRRFNSSSAVVTIFDSARRLTNPGKGTANSIVNS